MGGSDSRGPPGVVPATPPWPAGNNVLVTGGQGFTGRYLCDELRRHGWQVWTLGSQPQADDAARHRCVDLSDATGLAQTVAELRPDAVVHLAAVAFVGHGDADDFYRVNLLGTRHLLAALAALRAPPASVLLASSANVYGNAPAGVLTEQSPTAPVNDYAVSKLAMEQMARLFMDRLPITLLRPFNYTGVGQSTDFLLPKIVRAFRQRAPRLELGNLDVSRDFCDVRAVAQAYRRLLPQRPAGRVFNVCSGRAHALRGVIAILRGLTGHEIEVTSNPSFVRANEVRTLSGSPQALVDCIGPWEVPPLAETLAWMLEEPAAGA